jgi:hypothetical protein
MMIDQPPSALSQLMAAIDKLRKHLGWNGEYSVCRSDGEPMEIWESLMLGNIMQDIDHAMKILEITKDE